MADDSPSVLDPAGATPVMAQFFAMKAREPSALLFFRMGDFYELFFDDAVEAATLLGVTLTHRGTHANRPIPMAGVPVHAAEAYLAKLIRAGRRVAVCEQIEDPAAARKRGGKAVVARDIVRVLTPGTLVEDSLLDGRAANRLAAVAARGGQAAVASVELSTGEVEVGCGPVGELAATLGALRPSEVLVGDRALADPDVDAALIAAGGVVQPMASALAEPAGAGERVRRLYGVATLDGFGALEPLEVAALGLVAAHLEITQPTAFGDGRAPLLLPPRRLTRAATLLIDPATRAALELERTQRGERSGALLHCVDRTVTAPGARLLAARLARPLTEAAAIEARYDAVDWLLARRGLRSELRASLKGAADVARALGRLGLGRGGPRDLAALRDGLLAGEAIAAAVLAAADALDPPPPELAEALAAAAPAANPAVGAFRATLETGLAGDLPTLVRDGGFVAPGVAAELDAARSLRDDSRRVVAALEQRLSAEAGVPLKVRHNAVLGYFVEATARNAEPLLRPPLNAVFIHRQTMANQVRFTTTELAELDARIAQAAERALAIEAEVFERWRAEALALAPALLAAAEGLARLDVAAAAADWAEEVGAVRPTLDPLPVFEARGARHPVVEAAVRREGGAYTPNDCALEAEGAPVAEGGCPRLAVVTGPNMAGKSTFLRMAAVLAVLAQAGLFVPAASLRLGVVDRLFSRVGAGDDLARGRSTFMTEMVETAAILNEATARSLVVLDEIGRGTATYDGLAIAWAAVEHLHDRIGCRALFATHYHELARLEGRLDRLANWSLKAREWNGDLVFLHEVGPGPADRSYGVQVAKLAGVPARVVARARQVLSRLEKAGGAAAELDDLPLFAAAAPPPPPEPSVADRMLATLDPDALTPREALDALYKLKAASRGKGV